MDLKKGNRRSLFLTGLPNARQASSKSVSRAAARRRSRLIWAGKDIAARASGHGYSVGCLLLLDVPANHVDGCAAARRCEVGRRPQHVPPVPVGYVGPLFAQQAAGYALEAVHEIGHGHLRWVVHQQMNMIVLAVHLHQLGLEVLAHAGEMQAQPLDRVNVKDMPAVFGHKDQMNVHHKNAVPA